MKDSQTKIYFVSLSDNSVDESVSSAKQRISASMSCKSARKKKVKHVPGMIGLEYTKVNTEM